MGRLDSKVILITGAAGGQGASEAELFVKEGAQVVLTDVNEEEGEQVAAKTGDSALFLKHDVSKDEDWRRVLIKISEEFGALDGILNNAGIYQRKKILDITADDIDQHYQINQRGAFLGIIHGAKMMQSGSGGSIVNVSSVAGMRGFPEAAAYVATKWALRGITRTAAAELADHNIRVNAILPGFVDTPMLDENERAVNEQGREETPLKRFAQTAEIAQLALFLLSEESAYITGADHVIDGGWSA